MRFKTPISNKGHGPNGENLHDPAGPIIQTHELEDGSMEITFDPQWAHEADWQVGDYLTWELEDGSVARVYNQQAELRKRLRDLLQDRA